MKSNGLILVGNKLFFLSEASRPSVGPTMSPAQWVLWPFPQGQSSRCMRLNTQPRFVLRLRTKWSYTSISPCAVMVYTGTTMGVPVLLIHLFFFPLIFIII